MSALKATLDQLAGFMRQHVALAEREPKPKYVSLYEYFAERGRAWHGAELTFRQRGIVSQLVMAHRPRQMECFKNAQRLAFTVKQIERYQRKTLCWGSLVDWAPKWPYLTGARP